MKTIELWNHRAALPEPGNPDTVAGVTCPDAAPDEQPKPEKPDTVIFSGGGIVLTKPGQIHIGDTICCTFEGKRTRYPVKEVLFAGTGREEILLNKKKNIYFITSMAISGSSWAKDVTFFPKGLEIKIDDLFPQQGGKPPH